ncbi:glycosyltransferase family 2 protein [Vibrio fortis]|uniref:glycosyltransferase family 2 protein n=1 Tax=Vibrio fortis TaxID=212667 RepID=UPI003EB9BFB0
MLSVVICTYNRASFLSIALESVCEQIVNQGDEVELLIIDNNSSDETSCVSDCFSNNYPFVKYFFERSQGLSNARNRALHEASFDYVAFLDDDAYVNDFWISSVINEIKKQEFDFFGGPYYPWYKDGKLFLFDDRLASNIDWLGKLERRLLHEETVSGGNCCFRKQVVLDNGGFNPDLGMNGQLVAYGEETEVQINLRKLGYTIGLLPSMSIQHYTPVSKQKLSWFIKRSYAEGRDEVSYTTKNRMRVCFELLVILGLSPIFILMWFVKEKSFPLAIVGLLKRVSFRVGFISESK